MLSKAPIYVIIAGSRTFDDYDWLKAKCNILIAPGVFDRQITIISGGANGADKLGERYAKEYGFDIKVFPADWKKYGKSAGAVRNKEMAENATHLIAFWDEESKGTKMMIEIAKLKGLTIQVVSTKRFKNIPHD